MYQHWYDYVKPINMIKKVKFCYMDTESLIAYRKPMIQRYYRRC